MPMHAWPRRYPTIPMPRPQRTRIKWMFTIEKARAKMGGEPTRTLPKSHNYCAEARAAGALGSAVVIPLLLSARAVGYASISIPPPRRTGMARWGSDGHAADRPDSHGLHQVGAAPGRPEDGQ